MSDENAPLFSRSGTTNALGKNSEEVKTLVPMELKERLQALATISGVNLSEYTRNVLMSHVYGEFSMLQMKSQGRNREGTEKEF
jgi:hypothetical protein